MTCLRTPANGAAALSSDSGRLRNHDFNLAGRAKAVYAQIAKVPGLLYNLTHRADGTIVWEWYQHRQKDDGALIRVAEQLLKLKNAGAPEATGNLLIGYLVEIQAELYAGREHRSLNELDVAEVVIQGEENRLTTELHCRPKTPTLLREAAAANRAEAAIDTERARVLELEARVLERRPHPLPAS